LVFLDLDRDGDNILKGDSLTAYEAAVEDLTVDPEDDTQVIPLTEDHVELALRPVAETVFPFRALETQKQWMSKHMKKPYDMTAKTMTNAMSKINNFLPYFPDAGVESKYSELDLIGILQFAVSDYYRAAFDLRNYIPLTRVRLGLSRNVSASNEAQSPSLTRETTMTTSAKAAKK
jgi:hypothetical protein